MTYKHFKPIVYRILIIEDDPDWFERMRYSLKRYATNYGITIETREARDCENAYQLMNKELFHAIAIDLRLPERPGGPLTSQPRGIELASAQTRTMPLVWAHIYTAWAKEHALELYRRSIPNENAPPIWEKASSDNEGEHRYTQKEWAQRILAYILPHSSVRNIPLISERKTLEEHFSNLSPLSESVEFALDAGRKHLPPGMARSCAEIHHWLETNDPQYELRAFHQALFLAETVQNWLWVQAGAWLAAMSLPHCIAWPLRDGSGRATRAGMERSLRSMLQAIAASDRAAWAATWLSYLHVRTEEQAMDIIHALSYIREMRNEQYNWSDNKKLDWEQLALPLRIVLDAAAYLAAYPILSCPTLTLDNRWRFTILKGEGTLPEGEWALACGELGKSGRFEPVPGDSHLYQLWPCPDGSLGLLRLWPFAEQRVRVNNGRTSWLLYGLDSHNPAYLWERSALDGLDCCTRDISDERLKALAELGAAKGT